MEGHQSFLKHKIKINFINFYKCSSEKKLFTSAYQYNKETNSFAFFLSTFLLIE